MGWRHCPKAGGHWYCLSVPSAAIGPPAVTIVAPDPIVRRAVRSALEERGELVVAEAEDEEAALEAAADALVWDAGLDGEDLPPQLPTPAVMLLADAAARGARVVPGTEMFLRQAAAQFTRWTGVAAPIDRFRLAFVDEPEHPPEQTPEKPADA